MSTPAYKLQTPFFPSLTPVWGWCWWPAWHNQPDSRPAAASKHQTKCECLRLIAHRLGRRWLTSLTPPLLPSLLPTTLSSWIYSCRTTSPKFEKQGSCWYRHHLSSELWASTHPWHPSKTPRPHRTSSTSWKKKEGQATIIPHSDSLYLGFHPVSEKLIEMFYKPPI